MIVEIKKISPADAIKYLDLNLHNRIVDNARVDYYADQMTRGEWKLTHQGISLSATALIDGQHRLLAVVKSGVTIDCLVAVEKTNENFKRVDSGKPRTARDIMSIEGVKNYSNVASGIMKYLVFTRQYNGDRLSRVRSKISNADILDTYKIAPDFYQDLCIEGGKCYTKMRIVTIAQIVGVSTYLIRNKQHDFDKVILFFRQIVGLEHATSNAIDLYRSAIVNDAFSSIKKLNYNQKMSMLKRAWNSYSKGEDIERLICDREINKALQFE